jgi:muconolactone delta-isomerase
MEYLVTMTTHVPEGVPEREVDDVRAAEARHTRVLARDGRVLRLWRPPLQPGRWQTLGLFFAADADDLEHVLRGMPLRVWRTDDVTPLQPHPNDPGRHTAPADPGRPEFLVTFVVGIPPGTDPGEAAEVLAQESRRAAALAAEGRLLRLWRLPGEGRNLGHWQADDATELRAVLATLPLAAWLDIETMALTRHPNDPALSTTG